jgi:pyruvate dehydrogenase E2 component (dihydrolipoamide acetyltransferase)
VVEWLVAEGDVVAEDQPLLKVETDKAVVELPSPRAGTVLTIHVLADNDIQVGDPLVTIGEAGEAPAETSAAATTSAEPVREATVVEEAAPAPASAAPSGPARRPLATPRTRALARKVGVDLASVAGSGSGGRITDDDVERASRRESAPPAASGPSPASTPPAAAEVTADGPVERVPLTHLRKVIAGAMRSSQQTSVHVTHVDEADVSDLVAAYRAVKADVEADGGKFSMLPFFVKALIASLQRFPMFNASVDEGRGEIVLKRYYNIGIAVDTPEGLIVPVVKNADQRDMVTLAADIADLADRARNRRLALDELKGGSCTITNIGPLGGVFATPIINQPELAIVGLHKIQDRPVVVDGEIVVRKMMYLSVSFDHRWIDGADAARFMSELVRLMSDPRLLMVRL